MTSLSPRIYEIDWTEPVIAAFQTKNDEIINLITSLAFGPSINFPYLTDAAVSGKNEKLLNYIKYMIGSYNIKWSKLLSRAMEYEDLARWIVSQAPQDYQWNLDEYAVEALTKGQTEIFNRYLKLFPNYPWNWDSFT